MTLMARLCMLCAMCALSEMALPQEQGRSAVRMIGGMLMLHLVISGARTLGSEVLQAQNLQAVFEALIR